MKALLLLTLLSSISHASEMPKQIKESVDTACRLVAKNDIKLHELCIKIAKTSYDSGYMEAKAEKSK